MKSIATTAALLACAALLPAAGPPQKEISNGQIRAKIWLPDAKDGYYKGTRFDWSGVIYSLVYKGHDYYGPWYTQRRADVRDFVYEGQDIVTGPASSITGPAEEFSSVGYEEAKAGDTFLKIGVGLLRKPDDAAYDHYKNYEVVDAGRWTFRAGRDFLEMTQELSTPDGYGYTYRKTIQLVKGEPQMSIRHSLSNTGKKALAASVYNHNFLVLDKQAPGPGYSITVPFEIKTQRPMTGDLAEIAGKQIVYHKSLQGEDRVSTPILGFTNSPQDYDFRVESEAAGAGMHVTSNRPLARAMLWSIRSVVAVEPYIDVEVEPGKEFGWTLDYDYYTLGKQKASR